MLSARAQANNPDIHHDDVKRIPNHPRTNGLSFCPLCSTSKYVLCTRTGGYIKVPFLALILACPPYARKRINLRLTRVETPRCTSARAKGLPSIPARDFFTNQLFDFLWKGDVRDSSANNMTGRTELPAASLSRFSRFLMEIHEMRHAGHALPQISMAKQK